MEKLKVSQIAQALRVSNQTVYNYLSKFRQDLEGNLIRENGKQYLTQDGFKILKTCLGEPEPVETVKGSQNLESLIVGLKETIDNLIHQHSEERQRAAEERQRSDTIILKLTNDIGSLQKCLEYREKETPRQVKDAPPVMNNEMPASVESPAKPEKMEHPAPIRERVTPPPAEKRPLVQRELSTWESVTVFLDDCLGFMFGKG